MEERTSLSIQVSEFLVYRNRISFTLVFLGLCIASGTKYISKMLVELSVISQAAVQRGGPE